MVFLERIGNIYFFGEGGRFSGLLGSGFLCELCLYINYFIWKFFFWSIFYNIKIFKYKSLVFIVK